MFLKKRINSQALLFIVKFDIYEVGLPKVVCNSVNEKSIDKEILMKSRVVSRGSNPSASQDGPVDIAHTMEGVVA